MQACCSEVPADTQRGKLPPKNRDGTSCFAFETHLQTLWGSEIKQQEGGGEAAGSARASLSLQQEQCWPVCRQQETNCVDRAREKKITAVLSARG